MRRFMLLAAVCSALVLMLATTAFAQTRGPSGADGTFNCEDFDDQGQAQEFSLSDPGDTNGLDEDGDGQVCEGLPTAVPGGEDGPDFVPGTGESTLTTPDGTQYSNLSDLPGTEPVSIAPGGPCATPELAPDLIGVPIEDLPNAFLNRNDPVGTPLSSPLDPDGNGIACDTPTAIQSTEPETATTTTTLPATGGPSLALIAGALLVGAGLVLRRR